MGGRRIASPDRLDTAAAPARDTTAAFLRVIEPYWPAQCPRQPLSADVSGQARTPSSAFGWIPAIHAGRDGRNALIRTAPMVATTAAVAKAIPSPLMKAERAACASAAPVSPPTRAATCNAPPSEPSAVC